MTQTTGTKRPTCVRCLRPQRACICQWIAPLDCDPRAIEVLFLQHPLEVGNAKGSARLLHLSLPNSRLVVGETFAEDRLRALLYAPFSSGSTDDAGAIHPILLYPSDSADKSETVLSLPAANRISASSIRRRLIVLDGTWRKSRKMLYLNPLLQHLPRLALQDPPASHYAIRKAHRPDQLSTYEATCYALMQLENDAEKYRALLAAFGGFVAQQQSYAGPERMPG